MTADGPAAGRVVAFSPGRAWLVAQSTLRDAMRQRMLAAVVLMAMALVAGAQWLRAFNFGSSELKLIADFGWGTMAFFGGVLTIAAGAQLLLGEIESRAIATVLAKPVRRSEFVVGKWLALAVIAGTFCAILTGVLAAVLGAREAALAAEYPEALGGGVRTTAAALGAAALVQWLKLVLLAALVLLLASFARSQVFVITTGVLVWVICELQYVAHEAAARGGAGFARGLAEFIGLILPDFQRFELIAEPGGAVDGERLLRLALYAAGYVVVAGALTVLSFRRREI
ncbi:MAG TPA: ABC transporter permease subunit [Opitutus sp.]|nr:ABC transporter permease subunit [Opitutus sp.]